MSSTLKKPKWTNATVLKDVVKEVPTLKQEVDGQDAAAPRPQPDHR
jgi:hypothetical protein